MFKGYYLLIVLLGLIGIIVITSSYEKIEGGEAMSIEGKKVLMLIAHSNFRDEEYLVPRDILEKEGALITVASSRLDMARGMLGARVKPDILLDDVKALDYDCIIFIGGSGSSEYFSNPKAHALARQAYEAGKIVCAICIAPTTLANAGILKGKRVTAWSSERGNLISSGATYTGGGVEVDGMIITADGPRSAERFGRQIVEALGSQ